MARKKFGWKPTSKKDKKNMILGYPCLIGTHSIKFDDPKDRDLVLPGQFGAIWQYSDNNYFVLLTSPKVANKYLDLEKDDKLKTGEEIGIVADKKEALKWLHILKISKSSEAQLRSMEKICGICRT